MLLSERTAVLSSLVYACDTLDDGTWDQIRQHFKPEHSRNLAQRLDIHPSACVRFVRNKDGLLSMIILDTERRVCDIVFCGTADVQDIRMNIRAWKTVLPLPRHNGDVYVHSGFLRQLKTDSTMDRIFEILDTTTPDWHYVVCGHSLGGALAVLFTVFLCHHMNGTTKLQVVTYGAPRVGNVEFAMMFDSLHIECTQIMHRQDPVPHMPKYGYIHAGHTVWVPETIQPEPEDIGYISIFTTRPSRSATFHSMENYRLLMTASKL